MFILNFHIRLCTQARADTSHNSPREHLSTHPFSPGNGLFETLISPIQRTTSLLYTYTALILAQPIFETLVFVITIQKISSDSPVSIHLLCTFNKSNQNGGLPIPLGICLLEASIHFSSNGSTHLVYAYTSHPLAQPLFETFIFVITKQKSASKSPVHPLIFVYLLQINSLTFRLKDVCSNCRYPVRANCLIHTFLLFSVHSRRGEPDLCLKGLNFC